MLEAFVRQFTKHQEWRITLWTHFLDQTNKLLLNVSSLEHLIPGSLRRDSLLNRFIKKSVYILDNKFLSQNNPKTWEVNLYHKIASFSLLIEVEGKNKMRDKQYNISSSRYILEIILRLWKKHNKYCFHLIK